MNIPAKKILSALLASAMLCGTLVSCESTGDPKDTGSETEKKTEQVTEDNTPPDFEYDAARTLFVSTKGDDTADGTWEHPLASLDGARKAVKKILEAGEGGVTVYFRGGDYYVTETVNFDESDSGTSADAPVVYQAYKNETVTMNGGYKIDPSKITSAADTWVAECMRDPEQAKELLVVDLSDAAQLPGFVCKHPEAAWTGVGSSPFGRSETYMRSPELFLGDTPTMRARWPEDGKMVEFECMNYTENDDADTYDGTCKSRNIFLTEEILDRAADWSEKSMEHIYMMGVLYSQFNYETFRLLDFDREGGTMKLRSGQDGWDMAPARAYFMNIPEELDVPGESYLDEEEAKLYFLPTDDYDPENVWYSRLESNIVQINDTKNLTFEGIDFKYSRETAVAGYRMTDFVMRDCDVLHTSSYGVYLDGTGILLSGCEIGDTNNSCVLVAGGDDTTLTSGRCVIENCYIHDCGRNHSNWGYEDLITTYSTGNVIRNCELANSFSAAIKPYANQLLVEYCDIHDVVKYAGDFGAIYWNTIAHNFGNVIRYNAFHDIGNVYGFGHEGIYHDSNGIGGEIYGNLFYNFYTRDGEYAEGAVKLGQTQFAKITNNIFVDVGVGVWNGNLSDPGIQCMLQAILPDGDRYQSKSDIEELYDSGFESDIWHETFEGKHPNGNFYQYLKPEVKDTLLSFDNAKDLGKYLRANKELIPTGENICENNIMVCYGQNVKGSEWMRNKAKPNYYDQNGENTAIFVDYENDNFALTEEGLKTIRETIPDFEELPLDKIGINK